MSLVLLLALAPALMAQNLAPGPSPATPTAPPPAPSPTEVIPKGVPGALVMNPDPALRSYVIQEGDNLWNLAKAFFKNPWLWPEFLKFNAIENPDLIYPGRLLLVPRVGVLEGLKGKNPEEVREIREGLEKQSAPVPITSIPTQAVAAPPPKAEAQEPVPAPTNPPTPTLKVTGSKSVNMSYSEARGGNGVPGGTALTNTGFDRHESLRLNIEGQLNQKVKIQGHFAQSDLADEDTYDLTLSTKRWEAFFGDFSASLPGSQYLSSGLASSGVRVKGTYDRWNLTTLYGTPRGRAVYQKFYGTNTQGPYPINGAPIVPGSESVRVDKVKLTRGVDYDLDYLLGTLSFRNRTIQPVELVEVDFQSRSALYDTQVYGYRGEVIVWKGTGKSWKVGQGWLRQKEQPDAQLNTTTARAAADTHLFDLDSALDLGPKLKLGGEAAYSLFNSSDETLMASRRGGAYRLDAESFQGPFHEKGKWSRTEASFRAIGNPLASNDFHEWSAQGDYKPGAWLYAQLDRAFQETHEVGSANRNQTDHGQAKVAPWGSAQPLAPAAVAAPLPGAAVPAAPTPVPGKSAPGTLASAAKAGGPLTAEYVFYRTVQDGLDPAAPFRQSDVKHTASLTFALPLHMALKASGEHEAQSGSLLGASKSRAGRAEFSSVGWKKFNFSGSAEWKLTDVAEASSNTVVGTTHVGNNQPSQSYNLAMEGKPLPKFSLTAKGLYSSDPPGPPKANVSSTYQTDPLKWLTSNGNYTLEFQQKQLAAGTSNERIHTGSGSLDLTPRGWIKLTAQPSFRLELMASPSLRVSENTRQDYRANLTPKWLGITGGYTVERFATWDPNTAGFPLNFFQKTLTANGTLRRTLGKVALEGSVKQSDQAQDTISGGTDSDRRTLTLNTQESANWTVVKGLALTGTHNFNRLKQDSPGAASADNPLLPYGADSFNTTYPTNSLNIYTKAHVFTGRVTEQVAKAISIYEEGGVTRTQDVIRGGRTMTYSPAAGFTLHPAAFLNWTGSYQFNGSRGEVATEIQKAQTALTAGLNASTNLSINWSWSKAIRPEVMSQQGTTSFTMTF